MKNSKLKIAMFEKNITQAELSLKTGIPRAYISLAINRKFNFDDEQKSKIARALRTSLCEVF
jgi:transcriptional regulator with XRE-family HTH domain